MLSVESKERQIAEVDLHTLGTTLHGKEETEDLYAAIDLVMDNLKRQVQKLKDKIILEPRRKPQE